LALAKAERAVDNADGEEGAGAIGGGVCERMDRPRSG
jgi:hypothetical protein